MTSTGRSRSRVILGVIAVLVPLTLVMDLLAFGPASHALNPALPWFPSPFEAAGLF